MTHLAAGGFRLLLAAAVTVVCWAWAPIGVHVALHDYAPAQLALLRFVVASLSLAAVAAWRGLVWPPAHTWLLLLVLGLFAVPLHHLLLNQGQLSVSAGATSVLAQSTPLFSALLARLALGERLGGRGWCCIGLGMVGATLVVLGGRGVHGEIGGGLLILVAALSWSVYFVLQRRWGRDLQALASTCGTIWCGTLLLAVPGLPGLPAAIAAASPAADTAVVLLGLFPGALAYLAWAYVLKQTDVGRAAPALFLVPPVAFVLAYAMLGEKPTPLIGVGTLLIIGALAGFYARPQPTG